MSKVHWWKPGTTLGNAAGSYIGQLVLCEEREPRCLDPQELDEIRAFIYRAYSREVLDDCADELMMVQANFVPDLLATIADLQFQLGISEDTKDAACEAAERLRAK